MLLKLFNKKLLELSEEQLLDVITEDYEIDWLIDNMTLVLETFQVNINHLY